MEPQIDFRILGQLLAADNLLFALVSHKQIGEFVGKCLNVLPGVDACGVCFHEVKCFDNLGSEVYRICSKCTHSEQERKSGVQKCKLQELADYQVIYLETLDNFFGHLIFSIDDYCTFNLYRPFVENFANTVALQLENLFQKKQLQEAQLELQEHQDHLQELVEKRTQRLKKEISIRKKIENQLRQSEGKYQSLVETVGVISWELDLVTFCFTYVSPQAEKMLGYPIAEWKKPGFWQNNLHEEDSQYAISYCQNAVAQNLDHAFDYRLRKSNGDYLWFHDIVSIVYNDCYQAIGLRGVLIDITQRKNLEEQLLKSKEEAESANSAKNEFLAIMGHEIRTPLNAINGFTELLEQSITDPKQKSYLEAISTGGKNLSTLINDILDLAKIETGKIKIHCESVDFPLFLKKIYQIFSIKTKNKNLDLFLNLGDGLPQYLILDELRLRQVLFNLLSNAIKYTHKGHVKISADVLSQKNNTIDLQLVIEDSGIGIAKADYAKIFQAFEQLRRKDVKQKGTGLGLAISKCLVHMMKGEIFLESYENMGSAFTITLPEIPIGYSNDTTTSISLDMEKKLSGIVILIVDDVQFNRVLIREFLIDIPVTIVEAENGQEVLKIVNEQTIHIILMDVNMPVMNGLETCTYLKDCAKCRHIPVIAVSAKNLDKKNTPFDDCLLKPISQKQLLDIIYHYAPEEKKEVEQKQKCVHRQNEDYSRQLWEKLEQMFLSRWQKLQKKQPIKQVEKFGKDLIIFGKNEENGDIVEYGNILTTSVEHFDIELMLTTLNNFPKLLEKRGK